MFIVCSLLAAIVGLYLTLANAQSLHPDWALAILLAAQLGSRRHWVWVLPAVMLHDWILFQPLLCSPVFLLMPMLVLSIDKQIGPAVPQRVLFLILACAPLFLRMHPLSVFLTMSLSLPLWYLMVHHHD